MNAPLVNPGWTEDRMELLKTLWAGGYSAGQIAARLLFVTRNGVIGKVHRMGLAKRMPAWSPSARAARIGAIGKVVRPKALPKLRRPKKPPVLKVVPMPPKPVPEPIRNPTSIMDLTPDQCRFPLWQDGEPKLYCGAPVAGETSWCAACLQRVSQPGRAA